MEDTDKLKKAQLSLGEPFALEFSEYTRKVRNNLMFLSILSIVLITNNLELTSDSSLLGLKLNTFSMDIIYNLIFLLTTYFLIHFIWLAWDYFIKWKLRLTGSNIPYEGGFADEVADNKSDISQTTLYSWWLSKIQVKDNEQKNINFVVEKLGSGSINTKLEHLDNSQDKNLIIREIQTLNKNVQNLKGSFDKYHSTLSDIRIPASLERFDKWFRYMKTSQSLRWIIIELLMPILIGISALWILFAKLYSYSPM